MGRKHPLILFFFLSLALVLGCANPVMPTGGPVDKRPPTLRASTPDTFAINVHSGSITLTFDEWVDLKNPDREVQVSPPQENPPKISVRGKSVLLQLQDSLRPNTTYQIAFGEAIRDITEGNPANQLRLVFSTGPILDSAWMERVLLDAQTGLPMPGAALLAFNQDINSDSQPPAPDFLAFADSTGRARLRYLPSKPLFLFGLKEPSPDLRYNRPASEWVGFENKPSNPYSIDTLWLFREEPDSLYLTSVKEQYAGKWAFKLSRPAAKMAIQNPVEDLPGLLLQKAEGTTDSFLLWLPNFNQADSLDLAFSIDGQIIQRTIFPSGRPLPPKLSKPTLQGPAQNPWPLSYDRPLSTFNAKGLHLFTPTDSLPVEASLQQGILYLNLDLETGKSARLVWDSAALIDLFSLPIPAGEATLEPGDFVEWTIDLPEMEMQNGALVWAEPEGKPEVRIPFRPTMGSRKITAVLPTGRYRLVKTTDKNKDGRWTPGHWKERLFPEKTERTTKVFELKAGFDVQTTWQ